MYVATVSVIGAASVLLPSIHLLQCLLPCTAYSLTHAFQQHEALGVANVSMHGCPFMCGARIESVL